MVKSNIKIKIDKSIVGDTIVKSAYVLTPKCLVNIIEDDVVILFCRYSDLFTYVKIWFSRRGSWYLFSEKDEFCFIFNSDWNEFIDRISSPCLNWKKEGF